MSKHFPSDRVGKVKRDVCVWAFDVMGAWSGTCGIWWLYGCKTPKENNMSLCPQCGKRIEQKGGYK